MTIVTKQISFTVNIDEDVINPMGANTWIYRLLNSINYEHEITSVSVDDVTVEITSEMSVQSLPLREI